MYLLIDIKSLHMLQCDLYLIDLQNQIIMLNGMLLEIWVSVIVEKELVLQFVTYLKLVFYGVCNC